MARLPKRSLTGVVKEALRDSGWDVRQISGTTEHPARYDIWRHGRGYRVRLYIWNLTHGGGKRRPAHEYRIQLTGIKARFEPESGGKTLILGWWDEVSVFAGFDYFHHTAPFGSSPSIQIVDAALRAAHVNGFAPHNKGNGELAIAFRPDFLATYIENLESLHQCGEFAGEISLLEAVAAAPASVTDATITTDVAAERQYAVVTTKRALRDLDFRDRVLTAYGHRCAMCGMQLKLLEAAHILPVVHPDSTDETRNGVALCVLHHRAYDRGLVTFDEKFQVRHSEKMAEKLMKSGHDGGLPEFKRALRPLLVLPPDKGDRPAPTLIKAGNSLRGW